ncbi:MAG: hypothetical protein RLZZ598_1541 [Pseudomonadota bacterium]|jgi:2-aminoadipate transaminase
MISTSPWTLAERSARMNPSVIREILKLTESQSIISLAGGLPAADLFPVEAMREATQRVLHDAPREAMQYAASEGYGPLREWIAAELASHGMAVAAEHVLITTGSQQGLDLVGKVLADPGSTVAVESPTYLGALQAFTPYEPRFHSLACDDEGALPEALAASKARFAYLLPNFQNPSGHLMSEARRAAVIEAAQRAGVPLIEDNPYGDLWFDAPPPPPLAARWPEGVLYLGSFSKTLVPGLRLGFMAAPASLHGKFLQAKQAADLHTPIFNQRVVYEVIRHGFLKEHVPTVRARYAQQRDAMKTALERHLPPGCHYAVPKGGMFFWLTLPAGIDAMALLPEAVKRGVAYVPGAAFYAEAPAAPQGDAAHANTLRLSFVTVDAARIERGVALIGALLREALEARRVR